MEAQLKNLVFILDLAVSVKLSVHEVLEVVQDAFRLRLVDSARVQLDQDREALAELVLKQVMVTPDNCPEVVAFAVCDSIRVMSLPKNRPKCSPTIFLSKLIYLCITFTVEKTSQTNLSFFFNYKKLPKVNNENSPNLVTLDSMLLKQRSATYTNIHICSICTKLHTRVSR
jgi:hypothetical protein